MPFLPQIRRYILRAFEEHILVDLQNKLLTQVIAGPPYDFHHVQHWQHDVQPLHDQSPHPLQVYWRWPQHRIGAGKFPFIGFVYKGMLDNKIGITETAAADYLKSTGKEIRGVVTVRIKAPGLIYFPPMMPGQDGTEPFCDTSHPGFDAAHIIWLSISSEGVLVHYCESDQDHIFSSHSIQIRDDKIMSLIQLYHEEYLILQDSAFSQSILFVLAKRIYRHLTTDNVSLANTSFPLPTIPYRVNISGKDLNLCNKAADYIEKNLHRSLELEIIAQALHISVRHLSRVFRMVTGQSVMQYVTLRRIEAAKLILLHRPENIHEISQLVGFSSPASFSIVFKRIVGSSPKEYREQKIEL